MTLIRYINFIFILLFSVNCYSGELIVGFEDKDIPILNEELRKKQNDIDLLDDRITVLEAATDTGAIVQIVNTTTTAVETLDGTAMPIDDTIPQKTEGDIVTNISTSITPTSATNKLLIEVLVTWAVADNTNGVVFALFQDDTAGALAATSQSNSVSNYMQQCTLTHYMVSGTTSATTFKLRAGDNAGTDVITINGTGGARVLGGVCTTSMTITEIEV